MSRVFFVDETCEDIEIFVDKNRVKTDDILVFNTANGLTCTYYIRKHQKLFLQAKFEILFSFFQNDFFAEKNN